MLKYTLFLVFIIIKIKFSVVYGEELSNAHEFFVFKEYLLNKYLNTYFYYIMPIKEATINEFLSIYDITEHRDLKNLTENFHFLEISFLHNLKYKFYTNLYFLSIFLTFVFLYDLKLLLLGFFSIGLTYSGIEISSRIETIPIIILHYVVYKYIIKYDIQTKILSISHPEKTPIEFLKDVGKFFGLF
jgi:hypothetical protein